MEAERTLYMIESLGRRVDKGYLHSSQKKTADLENEHETAKT